MYLRGNLSKSLNGTPRDGHVKARSGLPPSNSPESTWHHEHVGQYLCLAQLLVDRVLCSLPASKLILLSVILGKQGKYVDQVPNGNCCSKDIAQYAGRFAKTQSQRNTLITALDEWFFWGFRSAAVHCTYFLPVRLTKNRNRGTLMAFHSPQNNMKTSGLVITMQEGLFLSFIRFGSHQFRPTHGFFQSRTNLCFLKASGTNHSNSRMKKQC